jgi:hypothetical protein
VAAAKIGVVHVEDRAIARIKVANLRMDLKWVCGWLTMRSSMNRCSS